MSLLHSLQNGSGTFTVPYPNVIGIILRWSGKTCSRLLTPPNGPRWRMRGVILPHPTCRVAQGLYLNQNQAGILTECCWMWRIIYCRMCFDLVYFSVSMLAYGGRHYYRKGTIPSWESLIIMDFLTFKNLEMAGNRYLEEMRGDLSNLCEGHGKKIHVYFDLDVTKGRSL